MKKFEEYLHKQVDDYAKKYEGSPCVDDLIQIKKKVSSWLLQRTSSIHEFYKSTKSGYCTSYVLKHAFFKMRVTFYKSGDVKLIFDHRDHSETMLKDKNLIQEYCLDVGSVYFIESEFGWKIGKAKDVSKRRRAFGVQLPFEFALRYHVKTANKTELEKYFHNYFKDKLINGEWYLIKIEDIVSAVNELTEFKLSGYPPDDKIFINRKYLDKINMPHTTITRMTQEEKLNYNMQRFSSHIFV
jgi:hypothetical protein